MNSSFKTSTSWSPPDAKPRRPSARHTLRVLGHRRTSERGIDGIERMRLVRDDIADRVADLIDRMQTRSSLL